MEGSVNSIMTQDGYDLVTMLSLEELGLKQRKMLVYGDTGDAVKRLQRLLNRNRFHTFRTGLTVDGEFGPRTGSRVQDVKYWAGYAKDTMRPVAGEHLLSLLGYPDLLKLSPEEKARRAKRLAKAREDAKKVPLRKHILAAAREDIGLLEGANNSIKFNEWWCFGHNDGGAYCVRAGSYWAKKGGCPHVQKGYRWQNTDHLLEDAKHARNGVHLTSDPQSGNGFVIDWTGHSDPDHYGVVVDPTALSLADPVFDTAGLLSEVPEHITVERFMAAAPLGGSVFASLEANATLSNGRQGVGYHTRNRAQCWFIVWER
jgi:hypothetical protein